MAPARSRGVFVIGIRRQTRPSAGGSGIRCFLTYHRGIKNALIIAVLLVAGCAGAPPPKVAEAEPEVAGQLMPFSGPEIWAYHAHWMGDEWRKHGLGAFRRIFFFGLPVERDGRIVERRGWPDDWGDLRVAARAAGIPLEPVITVLDTETFSAIFANRASRERLVAEVVSIARSAGGVHLDIEAFDDFAEPERIGFRAFVAELRRAFDAPPRKILTAFVPARGALYGPAELAMLDAAIAQGYDVHWEKAPNAGPVALLEGESPAAWQTAAANLAAQGVAPEKILFSTPFYGYEWPTVSGEPRAAARGYADVLTYAPATVALPEVRGDALTRARQHGLRREAASGAPWYSYVDAGGWRQGWFDDAASLTPRLDFTRNGGYRGVAAWVIGYDGGALVETIRGNFGR